jgi:hypothetical protein
MVIATSSITVLKRPLESAEFTLVCPTILLSAARVTRSAIKRRSRPLRCFAMRSSGRMRRRARKRGL